MNNPNEGQSILTEKVSRALLVRTDTVAMKAALEALAHLETSASSTTAVVVDSRSVRTAMEQDALQQALSLQHALEKIVDTVTQLRQGCSDVARTAQKVKEAIYMPVITTETANTMLQSPATTATITSETNQPGKLNPRRSLMESREEGDEEGDDVATVEEQKLAAVLSDAFLHRDLARQRLNAVHAFLEKFDLSEQDSKLLDHYNFEDATHSLDPLEAASIHHHHQYPYEQYHDGLAFLHALERVRKIRYALNQTFGQDSSVAMAEESNRGLASSSALRMMESLSQKQESAYERLYHWLQKHLQLFPVATPSSSSDPYNNSNNSSSQELQEYYSDEALQNGFVLQALYTLRHVPAFYTHLTELIAASRRASVTRRFLLALTAGSLDAPPIEMKAHDSVACTSTSLPTCYDHVFVLCE